MISKLVAVALAGSATLVAAQNPPLPSLPNQFEAWVACNIVNKNYTVTVHEVYDAVANRALLSMYHPLANSPNYVPPPPPRGTSRPANSSRRNFGVDQGVTKTIFDYNQDILYHTNSSGCYAAAIDHSRRFFFAQGAANHIPTVSQWFAFGSMMGEMYMGTTRVNGETVMWWRADLSNSTANTTMYLDYYFSTPGWHVWNGNGTQIPVALNLTGSRPNYSMTRLANGSMVPVVNGTHTYHHVYMFNGFHVGPPRHAHDFSLPAGTTCVSMDGTDVSNPPVMASASSSSSSDGVSSAAVAAIAIVSALLGAVIAFIITKRTQQQTSAQPTFSNALATNPAVNDESVEETVA
mmetsp:Transcript_111187/g.156092  ORF Transcript_111187/g.156092 Transcript_111187/m.156092 type:complete len:350 (-) Transcript_111187:19-1068(-)